MDNFIMYPIGNEIVNITINEQIKYSLVSK